jgi:zinc transporter ZupT
MANELKQEFPGAGGTSGGLGEFCVGLLMVVVGGYLILNQVTVSTTFWAFWGYNSFGLTLLPLLAGIGWLFFDGRSTLGWLLVIFGAAIIFIGIIANLSIYFRPTSLFNTVLMLVLLVGGLGLIARALRPH